jgi:aspartate 1-decarboxylase
MTNVADTFPAMNICTALAELRAKVTDASVDYVGSITIHEDFCSALGLLDRQMVQVRNERTGLELWTYVIFGHAARTPKGTICLNGAAAHLVSIGEVVCVTTFGMCPSTCTVLPRRYDAVKCGFDGLAGIGVPEPSWAASHLIDVAVGKIHRPRVSAVESQRDFPMHFPSVGVDESWGLAAGMVEGQQVHVVNVTNGQRDVLSVKFEPTGSKHCVIYLGSCAPFQTSGFGSRPGYAVGDIVIVIAYAETPRKPIQEGRIPQMKICFPFETPSH